MADLTTLEAVKDYLQLDPSDSSQDGQIGRLITSESQRFMSLANNPILSASYTEMRDGNGTRIMVPRHYPVISVQSVTVDGDPIPAIVNGGDTGFKLVDDRIELVGYVFTNSRVSLYYGYGVWPSYMTSSGVGNVTIVYTAGYASIPADVEQAVIEMVGLKIRGRSRIGVSSQSVSGESTAFTPNPWVEIQSVIDLYTRVVI